MNPKDLKAWRKRNDYTQDQLAQALSVHVLTVSRWERGAREIPPFLHLALEALQASIALGKSKPVRKFTGGRG